MAVVEAVRLHRHAGEAELVQALVPLLVQAVEAARASGGLVLLSGGSTPVPAYRALALQVRDWSGVTLALVDERRVADDDAGSNARMLRDALGAGEPGGPAFWPLIHYPRPLAEDLAAANARFRAATAHATPALVLLGMGEDGHTASLFPGSADLPAALRSAEAYAALDASGCPGAQSWPQRLSLTPAGWKAARRRLLVLRGAKKRAVLDAALQGEDALALPVRSAIAIGDAPLDVHWCP